MNDNSLTKDAVKELMNSYDQPQVTDELYSFGAMMLSEVQERGGQVDSKATVILGWATAILAFLFTQLNGDGTLSTLIGVAAGAFALLTVLCAYNALRARKDWRYASDLDWFEKTALSDSDELKRFHIRSIHEIRQNQKTIIDGKGKSLLKAQCFLVIAAGILTLGIVGKLFFAFLPIMDRYIRVCFGVA